MAAVKVVISAVADNEAVAVRVAGSDGDSTPARTVAIPSRELARTGFEESLERAGNTGIADSGRAYAAILRRQLASVLGPDPALRPHDDVLVVVAGRPSVHRWAWESLTLPPAGDPKPPRLTVTHVPEPRTGREVGRSEEGAAVLGWIGARPGGDADIPRYQVFGRVAREVLAPGSRIRPHVARTAASLSDLEAVVELAADAQGFLICHLDAHGTSRVLPSAHDSLVRGELVAHLEGPDGPVELTGDTLALMLARARVSMFATNACFGAEHRVISQYPFPGRIVDEGRSIAIGARDPLAADAATTYFETLYRALASGQAMYEAHRAGVAGLSATAENWRGAARSGSGQDLAARWLVQQSMWASHEDELLRSLPDTDPAQPALPHRDYLGVAALGGTLGNALAVVEDRSWGRQRVGIAVMPGCDLTLDSAMLFAQVAGLLFERTGSGFDDEAALVGIGPLNDRERADLIARRFTGPRALIELLADLVPCDLPWLDDLAERAGGDTASALIEALTWGSSGLGPGKGDIQVVSDYLAWARQESDTAARRVRVDDPDTPDSRAKALWARTAVNIALPIVGIENDSAFKVPVVRAFAADPKASVRFMSERNLVAVAKDGDRWYLAPHHWCQITARHSLTPEDAIRARATVSIQEIYNAEVTWNRGSRLAALSWLGFAVAARQLGVADAQAAALCAWVIAGTNRSAARQVVAALRHGRPGFSDLQPNSDDAFERLDAAVAVVDENTDDSAQLEEEGLSAERATALLHAGRPAEALAVTTAILHGQPADETTDLDVVETHAYALARTGRLPEAFVVAVGLIQKLPELTPYHQCEVLHLLGELAERQGRYGLAIRHFLEERALGSPAAHRNLHNRHHLYGTLRRQREADDALVVQVAEEGFGLARTCDHSEHVQFFTHKLAEAAAATADRSLRLRLLDKLDSTAGASDLREVRLARAMRDVGTDAAQEAFDALEDLAAGDDEVAAQASLSAAALRGLDPARRVDLLEHGAGLDSGTWSLRCKIALLGALWESRDFDRLGEVARELVSRFPTVGDAHYALARVASETGDTQQAVEHLARAVCYQHNPTFLVSGVLDLGTLEALSASVDERALLLLSQHIFDLNERRLPPEEGALPGLELVAALDRVGHFNSLGHVDPRTVQALEWASERAWDRGDLAAAIVARQHVCDLLRRGGPRMRRDFAVQLGWLATLLRQQERLGEAERCYQQAIELAHGEVEPNEQASLIGRYANLLHQTGDFETAVRLQWSAVCVKTGNATSFPPSEAELRATLSRYHAARMDVSRWALLQTNLARCLLDSGRPDLARVALDGANATVAKLDPDITAEVDHNLAECEQRIPGIRGQLD